MLPCFITLSETSKENVLISKNVQGRLAIAAPKTRKALTKFNPLSVIVAMMLSSFNPKDEWISTSAVATPVVWMCTGEALARNSCWFTLQSTSIDLYELAIISSLEKTTIHDIYKNISAVIQCYCIMKNSITQCKVTPMNRRFIAVQISAVGHKNASAGINFFISVILSV